MPISGNSDLDTAYVNAIQDFDTFASELEEAATEEGAVPAGGANDEYDMASKILSSTEFKRVQDKVNQMRAESSADSAPKYYST
jgi:hypothetical protein